MNINDKITQSIAETAKSVMYIQEASASDVKKILAAAKKAGADITGSQIDFGEGSVIEVSIEKGKIKFDGGKSSGVEYFNNAKDAIMAIDTGIEETEVQDADKDFVDLHSVDDKEDPEQKKYSEEKEEEDEDDVEEGNAFGQAVTDAKKAGKKKFMFQGKEYKVESTDLEEATMSQGVKTAATQIYSLEKSLKVGSNLNKGINKSLEGKYDADFKKMQKAIGDIVSVWEEIERDFSDMNESTDLEEALSPKDFVNGGDEKITQREVDGMLSKLFGNDKMLKSLEANKAYKDGYAGKTKNPYKKDTADYHLFILGQQSADADAE